MGSSPAQATWTSSPRDERDSCKEKTTGVMNQYSCRVRASNIQQGTLRFESAERPIELSRRVKISGLPSSPACS
eukprot:6100175-Amphidinium_carterae.1